MCILLQFFKIPLFLKRKSYCVGIPSKACWLAVSAHCGGDCGLGHLVDTCHQSTNCDLPRVAQALFEPAPGSVGAVGQLMHRASSKMLSACFTITTNIGLMCIQLASQIQGECFDRLQFSSVAQSCPTLCDPMNCSTPGLPVHHQFLDSTQTHVHWVGDAIQPSRLLSSSSPLALNLFQHQSLFQWGSSSHQVAKVLEFQLQHQSFQWTPRTDLL